MDQAIGETLRKQIKQTTANDELDVISQDVKGLRQVNSTLQSCTIPTALSSCAKTRPLFLLFINQQMHCYHLGKKAWSSVCPWEVSRNK